MSKAKKRFIDANALKKAIDHAGVDMLESADYACGLEHRESGRSMEQEGRQCG